MGAVLHPNVDHRLNQIGLHAYIILGSNTLGVGVGVGGFSPSALYVLLPIYAFVTLKGRGA